MKTDQHTARRVENSIGDDRNQVLVHCVMPALVHIPQETMDSSKKNEVKIT